MTDQTITSVSREHRVFRPSAEFKAQANLGSDAAYKRLYAESVNSPEKFWGRQAKELLPWRKPFKKVLEWKLPHAKWFQGGQLNVSENCLDRHLGTARANKAAIIFEGEPGRCPHAHLPAAPPGGLPVRQRARPVSGIGKGDRAAIYMPMVPEAAVAMLACARLGRRSTRSSSAGSPARRSRTGSTTARRGSSSPPTAAGGAARSSSSRPTSTAPCRARPTVEHVDRPQAHRPGRADGARAATCWWHDFVAGAAGRAQGQGLRQRDTRCSSSTRAAPPASPRASSTRRAGYLLGVAITTQYVFDLKDNDVYFCTADVGWVTGPQLRRLRPARQRRHGAHVRGRPESPRARPVLGRSSTGTGVTSSTRRPRRSAPSCAGATTT